MIWTIVIHPCRWLPLLVGALSVGAPAIASDLPCLIKPQAMVVVGSPVTGILDRVAVDQGDLVQEGQVLAVLESSLEQSEVRVARAKADMDAAVRSTEVKMAFSRRKAARAKELSKTSAIASHELDEAETEVLLAEAAHQEALEHKRLAELELQRAETALALRTVKSPMSGVVVERYAFPGELIRQSPILKLAKLHPLRVDVFVPLSWLGKISTGMRGEVSIDTSLAGSYSADVILVNPVTETASSTFQVSLALPNPEYRIPAGLPCMLRFLPK